MDCSLSGGLEFRLAPGRPRNDAKHLHAAVNGLVSAMEGLLATLGDSGPKLPPEMRHAPRAAKSKVVSGWSNYTPAQRAARISAMKAGHARRKRALPQKGAAKVDGKVTKQAAPGKASAGKLAPAARNLVKQPAPRRAVPPKPAPAPRKRAWAAMSPEQRAERIAKMKAGRGQRLERTPEPARV